MYDFLIFPEEVAKTPRHWGLNIEVQDYHDEVNLWDWLADSGATIVREFHPSQCLRKGEVPAEAWDKICYRADLDSLRTEARSNPEGNVIQWDAYAFDRPARWMGVPDGIIRKVTEIGVQPLVSIDYPTTAFARPLVKDLELDDVPGDDQIDWSAAASAYDYHFAFMYHFAKEFGSRYFLMHNEPECVLASWYLPKDLAEADEHPCSTPEGKKRVMACVTTQWGVLAMLARMAMDDVREIVGEVEGEAFFLAGPASGAWEQFWRKGGQYMDSLDYHHYHPNPVAFKTVHARVAARAAEKKKRISCSEFNVKPGNVPFTQILFEHDAAIAQAKMLMQAMQLSSAGEPVCDFMTLYLFTFPACERNHKSLLYGDTNCLDWSTYDFQLQNRPDEWYPTFEEQQMRHATPAYHVFRMLARCVPGMGGDRDGHAVLRTGNECLIDDAHGGAESELLVTAIDAGEKMFINILNPGNCLLKVPINLEFVGEPYRFAVVRMMTRLQYDEVVAEVELDRNKIEVDVPHMSFAQVILTPLALDRIESVRIEETTTTPGTIDSLYLYQTTRLRALATIDGDEVDVTCLNTVWTSSEPWIVPVYQGGLVQRLRRTERDITISVRVRGGVEAQVVVKGTRA